MTTAVLFLLSSLDIGGSERKTVRVVNALHQRGFNVHLGWLNGPETLRHEILSGIPTVCLDRRGKFSWRTLRRLEQYVRVYGITRIICMNLYPLLYAKALRLVMSSTTPVCVVMVNVTDFASRMEARQMVLYAPLMRRADLIVFGSDYQFRLWIERYHLLRTKCRYIHNGVDSDYFSVRTLNSPNNDLRVDFGFGPDDFIVGTVGKFRPEKQQRDLIEAVTRLRAKGLRASALIVGDGEMKRTLKKQATDAGVADYVKFLGEINDVRLALLTMDVFVLTSVAGETFSNAALEAMAMGRPVVMSDISGAREMIWEGVNGYLYPAFDVEQLTTILKRLVADLPATRRLGEEARRVVVEQFSFSRMVDEYAALCGGIKE